MSFPQHAKRSSACRLYGSPTTAARLNQTHGRAPHKYHTSEPRNLATETPRRGAGAPRRRAKRHPSQQSRWQSVRFATAPERGRAWMALLRKRRLSLSPSAPMSLSSRLPPSVPRPLLPSRPSSLRPSLSPLLFSFSPSLAFCAKHFPLPLSLRLSVRARTRTTVRAPAQTPRRPST